MKESFKQKAPIIIALTLILLTMPLVVNRTFQPQDIRNRAQEELGKGPIAPYVSITSPAHEARVAGTTDVNVEIMNNAPVSGVEFYVDNALRTTVKIQPFKFTWNAGAEALGMHSITVRAYDRNLNVGTKTITIYRE